MFSYSHIRLPPSRVGGLKKMIIFFTEALVRDAIEHSAVFVFGELLACPNVQALENTPDGARLLNLLRLFAFGVYPDFKARKAELPEVTPGQLSHP